MPVFCIQPQLFPLAVSSAAAFAYQRIWTLKIWILSLSSLENKRRYCEEFWWPNSFDFYGMDKKKIIIETIFFYRRRKSFGISRGWEKCWFWGELSFKCLFAAEGHQYSWEHQCWALDGGHGLPGVTVVGTLSAGLVPWSRRPSILSCG